MKKVLLILFLFFSAKAMNAQVGCNFNYTQSGNTVTFQMPLFPLIYVVDSLVWVFGDGTSSAQSGSSMLMFTPHVYALPGVYLACLNIWLTPLGGTQIMCTSCDTILIGGTAPCNASYIFSQLGSTVNFTSTSSGPGPILGHSWNFGDGSPFSNAANPVHTYASPGTYVACHTIQGSSATGGGFSCTYCDTIIVGTAPCNASYSFTQSGGNVNFTSTSSGPGTITSHSWNFGDGSPVSSAVNPTHTYAAAGVYNACHTIMGTSSIGITFTCTYCDSITVSGPAPCNASYVFTQSGNIVSFTSTSSGPGPITGHSWNFGDGSPLATSANPVHTYASPGTYVACHTISGGSSAGGAFSCTFCDTIVIGSIPCNASYTFTQSGSVVNFTSTSSGPGTIFSHSWNFGDGSPVSNAVNPSHIYATAGVYSACHTIIGTSPTGTFTCTYCDSILISGPAPCNASFVFSQSGNIVSFTSTSSGPSPITSHSWNFGDGSPLSSAANPVHTYTAPGTYIVCHTISGGGAGTITYSCTTCDTLTISGGGTGSCNITANFSNSAGSLNVSFSNMTTCTGCTSMTYKWNFGDGSPVSTAANPSHTYTSAGTYTVCLISTGLDSNSSPCIDTTCKAITVVGSSGIDDIEGQSINFHPNPSSGLFTYSLMPGEIMSSMEIMDLTGRRVLNYSTRNNGKDVMLDLSYVPNGMYYVHLRLQNGRSLMAKVQVRH